MSHLCVTFSLLSRFLLKWFFSELFRFLFFTNLEITLFHIYFFSGYLVSKWKHIQALGVELMVEHLLWVDKAWNSTPAKNKQINPTTFYRKSHQHLNLIITFTLLPNDIGIRMFNFINPLSLCVIILFYCCFFSPFELLGNEPRGPQCYAHSLPLSCPAAPHHDLFLRVVFGIEGWCAFTSALCLISLPSCFPGLPSVVSLLLHSEDLRDFSLLY